MNIFINKLFLDTIEKIFHGFGFGIGMSTAYNIVKKIEIPPPPPPSNK
jgi:hypothetical protein